MIAQQRLEHETRETRAKCLLVDDREDNLLSLEVLLRDEPIVLHKARSGREALELLLRNDYAVALVDVQMPGMDGFELASLMRGKPRTRRVPVIFVTATSRDRARTFRGYESGAVDFLYKPLDPFAVQSKVRVFVEMDRQRRRLDEQLAATERALDEAEAARAELRAANDLRERLLSVVSHDLRSPLAAIVCAAEILQRDVRSVGEQRLLDRIERSARRMADMIRQLLDFSQARLAGGFPVEPKPCDLVEACRCVIEELATSRHGRELSLEAPERLDGRWDRGALSQVISNLIGNAIQHGADAPVRVRLEARGAQAVLEVRNSGDPIPADLLHEIFEPFRRGPAASGSRSLGLGLYIARSIVAAHRGTIEVKSSTDGTSFTVVLPRERPS